MKFTKYQALGNDYIVLDPKDLHREISDADIKALCNRHYGVGSDGVLFGPSHSDHCDFSLKIFNPDASEAEKSGNGLRIFSRYLWDCGFLGQTNFLLKQREAMLSPQFIILEPLCQSKWEGSISHMSLILLQM